MIRVALRGLAGRKLRSALTAVAIVLGVAMVSGSFVLTDTISRAFDAVFSSAYRNTDAVVTGKSLVDWSASGNATVDDAVLRRVKALPEMEAAAGTIMDIAGNSTRARLLDRDGEPIGSSGNPNFGFGVDPAQPAFNPMELVEGEWAVGGREVVIDKEAAAEHGFRVGDEIDIAANGPTRRFTITGLAGYGDVDNLAGATFAVWDVPTARTMLDMDGYTGISVAGARGVSNERLLAALRDVAGPATQVRSGEDQAAEDKKGIGTFIAFIRGFLLAFGGVALLVGGFVIFNTLSITVAQRTRELATLRTLGASRRQVRRSVVIEAFVVGVIASVIGIVVGVGLAAGLSALFKALGLELPQSETVYAPRTFIVSMLVGVLVTVVAGLMPAIRATRVAPIAAVREGAVIEGRRRLGPTVGVVLLVLGTALLAYAVFGGSIGSGSALLALAVGALLLLVGLAAVASTTVRTLALVVGAPARRAGGVAGRLAADNAVRNPARTAATAAALMIGLALVTFVAVLGAGVRSSLDNALLGQIDTDYVVTSSNGWTPFPAGAGNGLAEVAGVEAASSIRVDRGLVGSTQVNVNSIDPATLAGMYRFEWTEGSDSLLAGLGRRGAVVKRSFARANRLAVGDEFTLRAPDGRGVDLEVLGLYQPPRVGELLGGVVISQEAFDRAFPRPQNAYTFVRGGSREALERAVAAYPDVEVRTTDEFVEVTSSFIGTLLNLLYVLLALSVIVSLFGMVNVLVLSVFERTRELGMLRAVGMTRRQVRRMVRHESVITALIGAGLGLPLGILLGAAVTHALEPYGVAFSLPVGSLVAFTVAAIAVGLVAAIFPARRAAKLNVLAALQYE